MITENELEALSLTWFQDSGWEYRHGPVMLDQLPGAIKAEEKGEA